jgi:FecR-like protein
LTYQDPNLKKASLFVGTRPRIFSCCALTGLVLAPHIFPVSIASAASNEVRITAIVKEANLVTNDAGRRAASVGDAVRIGNEIATGIDSRAELTFENKAVARLSANAALTLKSKNVLELSHGAVLLQFPGRTKGKVRAGAVSAAVGHATALLEYEPTVFKFLVLEGSARLYRPAKLGDSVLVHRGEMIFGNATAALTDPVNFDIERFVKTCPLVQDFLPLSNERLITAASERQQEEKSKNRLIDTNLVIFRGSSLVSVVDPANNKTPKPVSAMPESSSSQTPVRPSEEVRP